MNKMNKKWITYKHLERFFTCQKYFVWNSNLDKALQTISNSELFENEEEEDFSLWQIFSDLDLEELEDYEFVEVIKNGFGYVNELFYQQIKNEAQLQNKKVVIVKEKSNEAAFEKTMEYIKNDDVDWIINPVFIHNNLISRAILFKKENMFFYSLIYSSKSKLKYYLKAYFDYNVLKKLNIQIKEYEFYNFDSKKDYQKAKDLSFVSSKYCWTSLNPEVKKRKTTIEEICRNTIIEKIETGIIKSKIKKNKTLKIDEEIIELSLYNRDFDFYIQEIEKATKINKHENLTLQDKTSWGVNPFFEELIDYESLGFKKMSGCLLNKQDILDITYGSKDLQELIQKKKSLKYVMEKKTEFNYELIEEKIKDLNKKVVWFDFEGFSMPYTLLPFTKPYQQLVFQVSIITTLNEEIIYKKNVVIDPKKLNHEDFIYIIEQIYDASADHYVVYNKSYEHTRIKEMIEILEKQGINKDKLSILKRMKEQIELKTIDLNDLFKITNSLDNIPPIFLHELNGFSSIKKIENYITENNLNLKIMIKPYKELEVKNGLMAMNKAIQRYLNSIGDNEWEKDVKNLEKYCENDVKAMIMVYFFIKFILNNK